MAQMNLSNTLWNDDSSSTIALVEQLKDRLLHTYIANNPNYSTTDKNRIPAELKAEVGVFQEKLNEFFLDHWVDFQRFLLDEGVDPETIDSWKEVQEFLEGLPDDETMWLKNKLTALDTAIAGIDQDGIGIFDVSAYNNVGGTYATYNGLSAALAAIPTASKRSGMTIRYIDSTSNQYKEYRYFLQYEDTTAGNTAFNNTANWQGIDDEPTANSNNLVKSGGVAGYVSVSQNTSTGGYDLQIGNNPIVNVASQKSTYPFISFVGNGITYSRSGVSNGRLLKDHIYRIWIKDISIDGITGLTPPMGIAELIGKDIDGNQIIIFSYLRGSEETFTLPNYTIYRPTKDIVGLYFAGRSAANTQPTVKIEAFPTWDEIVKLYSTLIESSIPEQINNSTDSLGYIASNKQYYINNAARCQFLDLSGVKSIVLCAIDSDGYFGVLKSIPSLNTYAEIVGNLISVPQGGVEVIDVEDGMNYLFVQNVLPNGTERYNTQRVYLLGDNITFDEKNKRNVEFIQNAIKSPIDLNNDIVGYITTEGVYRNNLIRRCTYIDVTEIDNIFCKILGHYLYYAFLKEIPTTNLQEVSFATGESPKILYSPFIGNLQVPNDAKYLYIATSIDGVSFIDNDSIYKSDITIEQQIEDIKNTIPDYTQKTQGIVIDAWVGTETYPNKWMGIPNRTSKIINVPIGAKKMLVISAKGYGVSLFLLKSNTPPLSVPTVADLCDGVDSRINIDIDSSKEIALPEDCVAIGVISTINGVSCFPEYIGFGKDDAIGIGEVIRKNALDTESLVDGSVISKSEFIHTMTGSVVCHPNGDLFVVYSASTLYKDEWGRTSDDWRLPITKRNIFDLKEEVAGAIIAQHGELYNGQKVGVVYNPLILDSTDHSVIYAQLSVQLPSETIPTLCTREITPNNLTVGAITPNTLSYDGHSNVPFSGQNFITMLYDLGLIDSEPEYQYDTLDNPKPFYYNGLYYKPFGIDMDSINAMVILTSSDMVNWNFYSSIGNYRGGEISMVINNGGVAYISYRDDKGGIIGYIIYDIQTTTVVADGQFANGIKSKTCNFIYRGVPYMVINRKPSYHGTGTDYYVDIRQEIVIYSFETYEPRLIKEMASHNGCQYYDIMVWNENEVGKDSSKNASVIMIWTEDRRKLSARQIANVAIKDISGIIVKEI